METKALPENILLETYFNTPLPPLWEVIYQEAIRGHHLLFSKRDVDAFETGSTREPMTESSADEVTELIMDLAHCSDLQSMLDMIEAQTESIRYALFSIYKKMLSSWGSYRKQLLN